MAACAPPDPRAWPPATAPDGRGLGQSRQWSTSPAPGLVDHRPRIQAMTALAELMARTDAVLLDFDGPICRVFAGHSAAPVALELRRFRRFLKEQGVISVNDDRNPEQLLLWVGEHHADLTCAVDDLLTVYE